MPDPNSSPYNSYGILNNEIDRKRSRASSKPPHIWTEDWNALSYVRRLELGREYAEEQRVAQERSVAPGSGEAAAESEIHPAGPCV